MRAKRRAVELVAIANVPVHTQKVSISRSRRTLSHRSNYSLTFVYSYLLTLLLAVKVSISSK